MNFFGKIKPKIIFLLLLIIFINAGCQNPEKPQEDESSQKTREMPEILSEMEQKVLETLYAVDGIPGIERAIAIQDADEMKTQIETEIGTIREEKEENAKEVTDPLMYIEMESKIIRVLEEEGIKADLIDIDEPPANILEIWFKLQQDFYMIHRQWNVLESHLLDANVPVDALSNTEHKLDSVTVSLNNQQVEESRLMLNSIMECLSNYRSYFQNVLPSEIFKLKYEIRQVVLSSSAEEYELAITHFASARALAEQLRPRLLEKDATDIVQKLELSMEDLRHQLESPVFSLIKLKSAIIMKNIDLMTVPFEASSS